MGGLVFAFLFFAGVHAVPAQAAGDRAGLSTQIQGIVSSALGATASQPLTDVSATKAEDAANQAVALAESIAADAASSASRTFTQTRGEQWLTSADVGAAEALGPPARPASGELSARPRSVPPRPRKARPHPTVFRQEARVVAVAKAASTPTWSFNRTTGTAPRPQRSASPERPRPPAPAPPRPDSSSAGQSGGQSTPVLSVLAVLAGLLLVFGFGFLPRALPRSAFRKPRLIALPPWHPG